MKTNFLTKIALLAAFLMISTTAFADVKIKIKQTTSGQSTENTTYIKGKRQRSEMSGGVMVSVMQCDLKRNLQISPASKTYTIDPFGDAEPGKPGEVSATTQKMTKGGIVTTTITNKDTGERKQMFGYTARHIIQTIETKSSPESCSPVNSKMEIDAWYIDATFALECESNRWYRPTPNGKNGGCQDKNVMKTVGAAKTGYAVYQKMTMFDDNGQPSFSSISEVTEISSATLDAGLFDVPTGYREVSSAAEMYSAQAMSMSSSAAGASSSYGGANAGSQSGMAKNVQSMAQNNNSSAASVSSPGAKKEGVLRVGMANVKTGSVGEGMNAAELSAAIRNSLTEYLKTPKVELVALEAKLPSAIIDEAKDKQCDYVIYATVSHKKGGGGGFGGMFGKVLAPVLSSTGMGGGMAGAIAGQAASTAIMSASQASANVKSKDELTLDIKLSAVADSSAALAKQYKGKANSDGEDVISPLIEQAAQAILDAMKR